MAVTFFHGRVPRGNFHAWRVGWNTLVHTRARDLGFPKMTPALWREQVESER